MTEPTSRTALAELYRGSPLHPGSVLFHCTAGEDRTGCATALLFSWLQVPEEQVVSDNLPSNKPSAV